MGNKRLVIPDRNRMKNLRQYKNMDDSEFDKVYANILERAGSTQEFEDRIEQKIQVFGKDYDLDDMNLTDQLMLRSLAQAMIYLEDTEILLYKLRREEVNIQNIQLIEKLSNIASSLRTDISKLQDDLSIKRKNRKSDSANSFVEEYEKIKKDAREFYESKMSYVYCDKCNMLLGTVWVLYPEEDRNKITLICNRKLEDGTVCGHKNSFFIKDLVKNRGTNKKEIMPESMI